MRAGSDALADYEMLELILFSALPRGDVKPLAKDLITAFGDFNSVISAPPNRLAEVKGVGDAVVREFKVLEAAAHKLAQTRVLGRDAIASWDALVTYCKTAMAYREIEQFRILYLDRKNMLIADEEQGRGTVDHVPVYTREIIKRALELNASSLILVHNHPSGDPSPSQADIEMTRQIDEAAATMNITVHDHIIVGRAQETSFRSLGLL